MRKTAITLFLLTAPTLIICNSPKAHFERADRIIRERMAGGSTLSARKDADLRASSFARGSPSGAMQDTANSDSECKIAESCDSKKSEAVIVLGTHVDQCLAERLEALVSSAGNRDVWFLHDHTWHVPIGEDEDDEKWLAFNKVQLKSEVLLTKLTGLRYRLQSGSFTPPLRQGIDGSRSGRSKSSFLKFVEEYRNFYSYFWHVETDVFYTGSWSALFDSVPQTSDLVATYWTGSPDFKFFEDCEVDGVRCLNISLIQTGWPLVRFSSSFATKVYNMIRNGSAWGHHETVSVPLCDSLTHCTRSNFPSGTVGNIVTAGWPPFEVDYEQTLARHAPISPNRAYHPVKCAADKQLGKIAKNWAARKLLDKHNNFSVKSTNTALNIHPLRAQLIAALAGSNITKSAIESTLIRNLCQTEIGLKGGIFVWGVNEFLLEALYSKASRLVAVDITKANIDNFLIRHSLADFFDNSRYRLEWYNLDEKGVKYTELRRHKAAYSERVWLEPEAFGLYLVNDVFKLASAAMALLHGHEMSIVVVNNVSKDYEAQFAEVSEVVMRAGSLLGLRRKANSTEALNKLWRQAII